MSWTPESISSLRLLLRHQRAENVDLGISIAAGDDVLPEALFLELMIVALNWPEKRKAIYDVLVSNGFDFPLKYLEGIQLTQAGWDYWSPFDKLLWAIADQHEELAIRLARYGEQNWNYAWLFLCHKLPEKEARQLIDRRVENKQLSIHEVSDLPYPPVLLAYEGIERLRLEHCDFKQFPDLCEMPNLRALSLSNDSHQKLPQTILKCTTLEELNIYASELLCLPSTISALKSLLRLDLSYCSKLSDLPSQLGSLKQLEKLSWRLRADLHNRSKQKQLHKLPEAILKLQSLNYLKLPHHKLSRLPPHFANLEALEYLDLRYNGFDHFPAALLHLDDLKVLQITLGGPYASTKKGNKLNVPLPTDWGRSKAIQQLDLSDSWLKGDLDSLRDLPHLRHLRLYGVEVNGDAPDLAYLRQLLPHCKIEL